MQFVSFCSNKYFANLKGYPDVIIRLFSEEEVVIFTSEVRKYHFTFILFCC